MTEETPFSFYLNRATCTSLDMPTQINYAASHHIESFNYLYDKGLALICQYMQPFEIGGIDSLPFKKITLTLDALEIGKPQKPDALLYPSECRIAGSTYNAPLIGSFTRTINDEQSESFKLNLQEIPIMVRSKHCHLYQKSQKQLVELNEDALEFGGYFVLNGLEKIIRLLVLQKRNYPLAFERNTYLNRGPNFTGFACQMKCVREDDTSQSITLHYVSDGNVFLRVMIKKQEFLIPIAVVLRALCSVSDRLIYNKIVRGEIDADISDRLEVMLRAGRGQGLENSKDCLAYLGANFRVVLGADKNTGDIEVGRSFLENYICIHLKENFDKLNILCVMIQKLYALVFDKILPDNLDSLCNQEVLLPGHLYTMIIREKIEEMFQGIRMKILKDARKTSEAAKMRDIAYIKRAIEQQQSIGKKLEYFLATGNLKSQSGLDLMQAKGYTIIADKLNNMRFLSHFRSIHRGAYFTEMKTTTVRKLLPEQWGFVCPVHTPDGGPCGLLNHISMSCCPLTEPQYNIDQHCDIVSVAVKYGMMPALNDLDVVYPKHFYNVQLDGKLIGYIDPEMAQTFVNSLRHLKITQIPAMNNKPFPLKTEIAYIPKYNNLKIRQAQFPGIFLFTTHARLSRPVKHLKLNKTEWISPLEQIYLSIAVKEEDIRDDTEYQEFQAQNMLSILASNVPLLAYNQSPRNMYQCQMAKQTMGTPYHNFPYRFDNKSYRIQNPQLPLVKCQNFEGFGLGDYPSGCNAVVAVLSYTGYDMEDAMILNKSSYERGFGHGSVYKSMTFELNEQSGLKKSRFKLKINAQNQSKKHFEGIDKDGVPHIGSQVKKGSPELVVFDTNKNEMKVHYHKDAEMGRIEQVALISNENDPSNIKFQYKIRYNRNPVIGDKFSSRHGQKGVLSVLWPTIDMPFSENGIVPDVIINPNAFPSRMTIGMLIESMAGKAGALEGKIQETEPFKPYEDDDPVKYFGKELKKHGYNYYGNEVMYSGIYGEPLQAEIFIGCVYYQRLRHMVSDKSQARSTGPVDVLTQQPVKGRKKYGGIRLGEMERDALIAHGISYCMHDRLMNCSDYSEGFVCSKCGSILSTYLQVKSDGQEFEDNNLFKQQPICNVCKTSEIQKVAMPFVLRYLTNELASMNIKLTFTVC